MEKDLLRKSVCGEELLSARLLSVASTCVLQRKNQFEYLVDAANAYPMNAVGRSPVC
jgi:hypothetical protein